MRPHVPSAVCFGRTSARPYGLVESLDGSGERTPFTDSDELAAALNRVVNSRRKNRRREKPKADAS
jgi:hypothetical protein